MSDTARLPIVGQRLPRAADAYTTPDKWQEWILADRGHGQEWDAVFHVGTTDAEDVWLAIVYALHRATVHSVQALRRVW
jgi:hypothetical protein